MVPGRLQACMAVAVVPGRMQACSKMHGTMVPGRLQAYSMAGYTAWVHDPVGIAARQCFQAWLQAGSRHGPGMHIYNEPLSNFSKPMAGFGQIQAGSRQWTQAWQFSHMQPWLQAGSRQIILVRVSCFLYIGFIACGSPSRKHFICTWGTISRTCNQSCF